MILFDPERQILFEDNHLIIINKLPSQIVQGDKTGDIPLNEQIKDFLKIKYNKPGNVYLGVVHRLDRPVGGILIFTKTSKALARLNKMLANREIQKVYWAVVNKRPPEPEGHLIHYLVKDQEKNKSFASSKPKGSAKRAELKYKLLKSSDKYHLLEIELMTGRHHQIRVQLAKIGCLIRGDVKYGFPRANTDQSIHLLSRDLYFAHPVTNENLHIQVSPPRDPVWDLFRD
ncbi:MAG TPA: RluA family pseudouridine synthase [Bacteroidales bacterium]|nr:RluA family pseudouridine synthase [Bacteroidales bacterium]